MSPGLPPRERNSDFFEALMMILTPVELVLNADVDFFEALTMVLTLVEHLQPSFSLSCHITIPPQVIDYSFLSLGLFFLEFRSLGI